MPNLLNVTTPVAPKGYEFANKTQQPQTDQVFNLGDTSRVQKPTERTEEYTNRDNKDGGFNVQVSVAKNPTTAMSVLRSIVGSNAAAALGADGNADILNKVTEFANEVMLRPSGLVSDMVAQEKEATIYSDPIWNELKNALFTGSDDMGEAILQFTKAAADASARDDILTSLSSNLRFLAQEAAPSREFANMLMQAADNLNGETFGEMKGTILSLLDNLQNSLLMNDNTKNLISLAIYNMSRYNGSTTALGESFNAILDMASSQEQADMLRAMFTQYIENADLPADIRLGALSCIVQGSASSTSSLSLLAEKLGAAMNNSFITAENLASGLNSVNSAGGLEAIRDSLLFMLPQTMNGALNNILKSYESTGNISSLIDRLSIMINSVDDMELKTMLAGKINEILGNIPFLEKDVSFASDSILDQQSLTMLSKELGSTLNDSVNKMSAQQLTNLLSGLNTENGAASIRSAFEALLPQNSMGELNLILRRFNATGDLNKLIDNLSITLNSVQNMEKKIILAQSMNEILGNLAQAEGINYKPPTSMANLMDFLAKNINDPSLKSLSSMSRSDIMQGLLTSPGVFTPLLHYLVPIQDGALKAFGELWADPDAENRNGSIESKHLFLCFDVENVGYFELDLQTQDRKLQVQLLCPSGTEKLFQPLKTSIPQIAAANGYTAEDTRVGTVVKRRDLTQVFPKIQDKRSGLNVKI